MSNVKHVIFVYVFVMLMCLCVCVCVNSISFLFIHENWVEGKSLVCGYIILQIYLLLQWFKTLLQYFSIILDEFCSKDSTYR